VDERALTELRSLAGRDAELSTRAAELSRIDDEVAAIRTRAEATEAFLAASPEEEGRRLEELQAAEQDLEGRRRALAEAEQAVAESKDDEARELAERVQAREADHVAVAQARVDRSEAVLAELRREAARVPEDRSRLYEIARRLPDLRPPADAASIVDWASHAHAELFVAAGQIDAERERVIREANELASMLVGEPTYGATVAQALARAEAHCVSSPGHVSESR
jgi:hypothetical protein